MNDIITNGTEIKQRIISETNKATSCISLAMAWFTDRDIANAIIEAKNRNVTVDIILSSNAQNETVKQMFREANISVHAFDTGDERGMMHHKFCLLDDKISINGSYNYSYNASNNNVENIHVSDDVNTYRQLLSEFERLKYNIDNNIDVNTTAQIPNNMQQIQPTNPIDTFSNTLSNLVYSSAQINTDKYKKQGYDNSKESIGNINIFKSNFDNIKEEIRMYATDDSLNSKKNIITSNINTALESQKINFEIDKQNEINRIKSSNDLEKKQISNKISEIKQEKTILESGNQNTGEKGLLQINNEIEKNNLEKKVLEQSFVVKKFATFGTIAAICLLAIFVFYLSIFFASALYKVFFEGNIIQASLEAGINPGLPQIINANAVIKIFEKQGTLFGLISVFLFLLPLALTNLKLLNKTKWVNITCFWIGLVIFDILVSGMVALNADKIDSLLRGQVSQMQFWEVVKHGEFYLIFVFGMLPLFITHHLINFITNAYQKSQKELVDAEKNNKILLLEKEIIDLNSEKESISNKIKEKEDALKQNNDKIQGLDRGLSTQQSQIEIKYAELLKQIKAIYDDYIAKITSGRIFTNEILYSVVSSYKSGFIEYLPEYYAGNEVTNRAKEIEQVTANLK
jgi:hypothetical protein